VLSVLNLGAVEPQIAKNLTDTARARHMAEAGIEWAFDCLADQDLSAFLAGPDGVQNSSDDQLGTNVPGQNIGAQMDATFCPNSPPPGTLPGLGAGTGTFAVTIRNDSIGPGGGYAGDQVLTGVAVDGGGKFADSNGIVILTATGAYGTSNRRITAVMSRNTLVVNGAVNLPGMQADTFMQGVVANQTIDGRDWLRTDANGSSPAGTGPLRYGITTQPGIQASIGITYEVNIENAFDTVAKENTVQGKSQSTGLLTSGLPTISPDSALTLATMQAFLTKLAANPATTVIQSSLACPLVLTGTTGAPTTPTLSTAGSSCPGNPPIGQQINLGTTADPKLVYFRGELDTSSNFTALRLGQGCRHPGCRGWRPVHPDIGRRPQHPGTRRGLLLGRSRNRDRALHRHGVPRHQQHRDPGRLHLERVDLERGGRLLRVPEPGQQPGHQEQHPEHQHGAQGRLQPAHHQLARELTRGPTSASNAIRLNKSKFSQHR
jgi:hypothetical protein